MNVVATPRNTTEMIGRRIRELRREYGWTAARLAEEVSRRGIPWQRGTVAKLENGRRDAVSVDELFALAWTFGVPPMLLLLPDDPGASVYLIPAVPCSARVALDWITGARPPTRPLPSYMQAARL